jgi:membrane-bound lytic murein transglycosylase D
MTASHRSSVYLILIPVSFALLLSGCLSSKPQAFKMAFLPSTPQPDERVFEAPPQIASSSLLASETPNQLQRALATPPRLPEVDSRLARAEEHFEAGKRLYQLSDIPGARREFDRALDLLLSASDSLPDRQRLELKLDQMVDTIYRYDLEGLGGGAKQQAVVYDRSPLDSIPEMTFPTDPNLRPKVKEEIAATVSQLPLEENDAVLSYIHYFSSDRGRRTLLAGLRRAGRYRPLIQRILDEEGVPQELIHLAQIESGFLPRARSNKKAVGMWQFVQFRGNEYGLKQTPGSDDRMDPEKATRAAARHLRDLYANFGDWYLAMAAYNCGPGCVERAIQRTGYADYWELRARSALPHDTLNYVPVILAITIMAKNPKDYALENVDLDRAIEYDTIHVDTPASLALIADAADCARPEIEELNPALLKALAPAGYPLRVPKGTSATVLTALDLVPASHRANWRLHRVAQGETLSEIARRFATPAASISAVNPRSAAPPESGDLLIIPSGYAAVRTPPPVPKAIAQRKASHRRIASSQKPAGTPVRKTPRTAYKTASVASKHRPAAN